MGEILRSPNTDQDAGAPNPEPEKDKRILVSVQEQIPGIKLEDFEQTKGDSMGAPSGLGSILAGGTVYPEKNPEPYSSDFWKDFIFEWKRYQEYAGLQTAEAKEERESGMYKHAASFDELRGEIVVDLGCGIYPHAYNMSCMVGARGYIGVERYNGEELKQTFSRRDSVQGWLSENIKDPYYPYHPGDRIPDVPPLIPVSVVEEDMLTFLRRLPDKSVSIFMCGIDETIIQNKKYREALKKEIARVLSEKGAFVSEYSGGLDGEDGFENKIKSPGFLSVWKRKQKEDKK